MKKEVCFMLYVKKSFLSGIVMIIGSMVLIVLAILYCFTEIHIPGLVYTIAWIGSILAVVDIVNRIERKEDDCQSLHKVV